MRGGIDLGGTKIQAVVIDGRFKVLGEHRMPTPKDAGPEGVVWALAEAIRTAAEAAGTEPAALEGVGVGSPGTVDGDAGTVANARNVVPGWEAPVPVGTGLADELKTPVHLGHDVRVGTMAEFRLGAGKPYKSVLGVFWGTGVGGGLVLNGRSWTGRHAAGEIGHMVIRRGGAKCPCGRKGCRRPAAGTRTARRPSSSTSCATATAPPSRAACGRAHSTATTTWPGISSTARSRHSALGWRRPATCSTSRP